MQRLGFLHLLSRKVTEFGDRPPEKFTVGDGPRKELLAKGGGSWSAQHDLGLLRGILTHGYGNWGAIIADRALSVAGPLRAELGLDPAYPRTIISAARESTRREAARAGGQPSEDAGAGGSGGGGGADAVVKAEPGAAVGGVKVEEGQREGLKEEGDVKEEGPEGKEGKEGVEGAEDEEAMILEATAAAEAAAAACGDPSAAAAIRAAFAQAASELRGLAAREREWLARRAALLSEALQF
ncbi:hypothetical protein MNEG_14725, partial [Monoraphidium neglectum]